MHERTIDSGQGRNQRRLGLRSRLLLGAAAGGGAAALLFPHATPSTSPDLASNGLKTAAFTSTVLGTPNGFTPDVFTIKTMNHGQPADEAVIDVFAPGQKAKIASATGRALGVLDSQLGNAGLSRPVSRVDVTALLASHTGGDKGKIELEEKVWLKGADGAKAAPAVDVIEEVEATNNGWVNATLQVNEDVNRQGELVGTPTDHAMPRAAVVNIVEGLAGRMPEPGTGVGLQPTDWTITDTGATGTTMFDATVPGVPSTLVQLPVSEQFSDHGQLTTTLEEHIPASRLRGDIVRLAGNLWRGITSKRTAPVTA